MDKTKNIIDYYLYVNKLKYKLREGFVQIGITKDRLESVAEHIYGCLMLSIAIDSEYDLNIDMYKVLKMLTIHELDEVLKPDFTIRSGITKEEKEKIGKESVDTVLNSLSSKEELSNIIDEFNECKTKEAKFCYLVDKLECDMQAKVYDLEGYFSLEKAKEDLPFYGDRAREIEENASSTSDFWILYDRPKFKENEIFEKLSRELIEENDEYSLTRILNDKEYEKALYDKLLEEANEVINANKKEETEEELADLLEVVRAIANFKNVDVRDVEKLRISKKKKRGGFYKRIYLESTCDQTYIDENMGCLLCVNKDCKVPTFVNGPCPKTFDDDEFMRSWLKHQSLLELFIKEYTSKEFFDYVYDLLIQKSNSIVSKIENNESLTPSEVTNYERFKQIVNSPFYTSSEVKEKKRFYYIILSIKKMIILSFFLYKI